MVITLFGVLLPQFANAGWFDYLDYLNPAAVGEAIAKKITNMSGTVLGVLGKLIAWAGKSLSYWLNNQQLALAKLPVIEQSWTIIRDFVNMFFILFLVIMAFGTIFDMPKYTYKAVLPNFLIAALLVNFSFTIGQYVISLGNGLAQVFLNTLGNFDEALANGLQITKFVPTGSILPSWGDIWAQGVIDATINNATNLILTFIFSVFFLIISLGALLVAFLFTLIRIPVLWLLLIVSPIAWVSFVLPSTRHIWTQWWDKFIQWVFFLPVYLFFLMFGIGFIANAASIPASSPLEAGEFAAPIWGQPLLLFIITTIFLVGGLRASFKVGGFAGSGAAKAMGAVQGGVKKYFPGSTYVRSTGRAMKQGASDFIAEQKERGIQIGGIR